MPVTVQQEASLPAESVRRSMNVVVSHSGKQHAYRHALAVHRCGALSRFITSGYYKPEVVPDRWLSNFARVDRALRRRYQADLPQEKVTRRWQMELPELIIRRVFGPGRWAEHSMFRRDAAFDHWVATKCLTDREVLYWGFQGSCLESLQAAHQAGVTAVAEFATAHVTKAIQVLSQEAERHPEWAATISNLQFPGWYQTRLEQEPYAADICVAASQFTVQSLQDVGIPANRIRLLPLGADLDQFSIVRRNATGPFRILFVGGVGQRKGIKYLLQAFDRMRGPGVELRIAGPLPADMRPLAPYAGQIHLTGRLDQSEIVNEMHQAHVLVLPSVFEGFGLVIAEAMATGMPVIASTHSAGPDIIREGIDGFVLEPDDVDGLAARLELLRSDRARSVDMGMQASERARHYSWDAHAARVCRLLRELTDPQPALPTEACLIPQPD